jgi:PadR family transcriptional regulator PadR
VPGWQIDASAIDQNAGYCRLADAVALRAYAGVNVSPRNRKPTTNRRCYHGPVMRDPVVREFLLGFWKIHILHHAAEQGVYGQWMLEELHHHGYRLSPGTLYPMLARMAKRGWLRATEPKRSKAARVYRLTPRGHEILKQILNSLDELYREV